MTSRLMTLARGARAPEPAGEQAAEERCDLCSEPVAPGHRHLIDLDSRELLCACRACALLFDREAAGGNRRRLLPERRWRLEGFRLDDSLWDRLRIPVGIAFFYRDGGSGKAKAFYPSPVGATESLLELDAWAEIELANPALAEMADDVEALLVDRARGGRREWLVPLDDCYELVGLIRTRWKGFGGGTEAWEAIDDFFRRLDERARAAPFSVATPEEEPR